MHAYKCKYMRAYKSTRTRRTHTSRVGWVEYYGSVEKERFRVGPHGYGTGIFVLFGQFTAARTKDSGSDTHGCMYYEELHTGILPEPRHQTPARDARGF